MREEQVVLEPIHAERQPPGQDRRWKLVQATMRRHGNSRRALIETLHTVQSAFGYLDTEAMRYVAHSLRVPLSEVYGVGTFYHFFNLKPKGEHTCVVCTGTACHIKGAPRILDTLERRFGVQPGGTTPDGKLSVLTARCLGACSLAPAVIVDGEIVGNATPEKLIERLSRCMDDDA